MRTKTRTRAQRGFTLIEIVIAFSILLVLVVLALGVISSMQGPATEVTMRADMTRNGNAACNLMLTDLQGGMFAVPTEIVGDLDGSNDVTTFVAIGSEGRAIKFTTVEEVTPGTPPTVTLGPTAVYAFVQGPAGDGDRDGLQSEWSLLRVSPAGSNEFVVVQHDICDPGQPGIPTGVNVVGPSFQLDDTANLRVRFTLAKQTGYDTQTNTRLFSFVTYDRTITLRNATPQPP